MPGRDLRPVPGGLEPAAEAATKCDGGSGCAMVAPVEPPSHLTRVAPVQGRDLGLRREDVSEPAQEVAEEDAARHVPDQAAAALVSTASASARGHGAWLACVPAAAAGVAYGIASPRHYS